MKPFFERIKHRKKLSARIGCGLLHFGCQPVAELFIAAHKGGQDQFIL